MDSSLYALTVEGEEVMVGFKDGELYSPGYDIEAERYVLALNGNLGKGPGVFLLALREFLGTPKDLSKLLRDFEYHISVLDKPHLKERGIPANRFVYTYLSFSEDIKLRSLALRYGKFSKQTWARLAKLYIRERDAHTEFSKTYNVSASFMAANINLPTAMFEEMIKDDRASVRIYLARNSATPEEIVEKLVNDSKQPVARFALSRRNFPLNLAHKILEVTIIDRETWAQKRALAELTSRVDIIQAILDSNDQSLIEVLSENSHARKKGLTRPAYTQNEIELS